MLSFPHYSLFLVGGGVFFNDIYDAKITSVMYHVIEYVALVE